MIDSVMKIAILLCFVAFASSGTIKHGEKIQTRNSNSVNVVDILNASSGEIVSDVTILPTSDIINTSHGLATVLAPTSLISSTELVDTAYGTYARPSTTLINSSGERVRIDNDYVAYSNGPISGLHASAAYSNGPIVGPLSAAVVSQNGLIGRTLLESLTASYLADDGLVRPLIPSVLQPPHSSLITPNGLVVPATGTVVTAAGGIEQSSIIPSYETSFIAADGTVIRSSPIAPVLKPFRTTVTNQSPLGVVTETTNDSLLASSALLTTSGELVTTPNTIVRDSSVIFPGHSYTNTAFGSIVSPASSLITETEIISPEVTSYGTVVPTVSSIVSGAGSVIPSTYITASNGDILTSVSRNSILSTDSVIPVTSSLVAPNGAIISESLGPLYENQIIAPLGTVTTPTPIKTSETSKTITSSSNTYITARGELITASTPVSTKTVTSESVTPTKTIITAAGQVVTTSSSPVKTTTTTTESVKAGALVTQQGTIVSSSPVTEKTTIVERLSITPTSYISPSGTVIISPTPTTTTIKTESLIPSQTYLNEEGEVVTESLSTINGVVPRSTYIAQNGAVVSTGALEVKTLESIGGSSLISPLNTILQSGLSTVLPSYLRQNSAVTSLGSNLYSSGVVSSIETIQPISSSYLEQAVIAEPSYISATGSIIPNIASVESTLTPFGEIVSSETPINTPFGPGVVKNTYADFSEIASTSVESVLGPKVQTIYDTTTGAVLDDSVTIAYDTFGNPIYYPQYGVLDGIAVEDKHKVDSAAVAVHSVDKDVKKVVEDVKVTKGAEVKTAAVTKKLDAPTVTKKEVVKTAEVVETSKSVEAKTVVQAHIDAPKVNKTIKPEVVKTATVAKTLEEQSVKKEKVEATKVIEPVKPDVIKAATVTKAGVIEEVKAVKENKTAKPKVVEPLPVPKNIKSNIALDKKVKAAEVHENLVKPAVLVPQIEVVHGDTIEVVETTETVTEVTDEVYLEDGTPVDIKIGSDHPGKIDGYFVDDVIETVETVETEEIVEVEEVYDDGLPFHEVYVKNEDVALGEGHLPVQKHDVVVQEVAEHHEETKVDESYTEHLEGPTAVVLPSKKKDKKKPHSKPGKSHAAPIGTPVVTKPTKKVNPNSSHSDSTEIEEVTFTRTIRTRNGMKISSSSEEREVVVKRDVKKAPKDPKQKKKKDKNKKGQGKRH